MSSIKGMWPTQVIHDETVYSAWGGMFIDQKGRVIEERRVRSSQFGCLSRCRKCIYFSRVGVLLPTPEAHCKWTKYGLADEDKKCNLSIFVEVEDA